MSNRDEKNDEKTNKNALTSLFNNRVLKFAPSDAISISEIEGANSTEEGIHLGFVKYRENVSADEEGNAIRKNNAFPLI